MELIYFPLRDNQVDQFDFMHSILIVFSLGHIIGQVYMVT